jgi:hypothetical protein
MERSWRPEPFEADDGSLPFERFMEGLGEFKFIALDTAITQVLAVRGLDLVRTEWLKAMGGGLHEFRVRHDAAEITRMFAGGSDEVVTGTERILLRVFVHFHGDRVVLLLGGYDKGRYPKSRRQQREIREARRLLAQFKERNRRQRRR